MQKTPSYVTILIFGAIFITIGYWLGAGGSSSERTDIASQTREIADPGVTEREAQAAKEAQIAEAQRRVLLQQKKADANDLATRAIARLDEASAEERRWKTDVEVLLTNDDGRLLASSPDDLKRFREAYGTTRPDPKALEDAKTRVSALATPIRRTLDDPTAPAPLPELLDRLRKETDQAAEALEAYQKPREMILALVSAAKRAGTAAAGSSLQDALAALREQERVDQLDAQTKIKEAKDAAAAAEAARVQRWHDQARDPTLLAKYQPFFAKGLYTGGQITNPYFLKEHGLLFDYPRPMSYQALTSADWHNVLNDFKLFLDIGCGRESYSENDRPKWPKPRSEGDMREYQSRWNEFKFYAQVWRELGVFSR